MLDDTTLRDIDDTLKHAPAELAHLVSASADAILGCEARRHPYGFVVVSLGSREDGARLVFRLHIWPEGHALPGSGDLMIHDHVYDITSHVLVGEIVQHEYAPSENGVSYALYRGLYDGPHSVLERTRDIMKVRATVVTPFAAGDTYSLPAGALHMVKVDPRRFTATILRTRYDPRQTDPIILAPIGSPPTFRFDRDLLDQAGAGADIARLFSLLRTPA